MGDPYGQLPMSTNLPPDYRALLHTRRRIISLLHPGANAFLSTKPEDTLFCSTDMRSCIMRIYLGCFVYVGSSAPTFLRCGCCNKLVLEKIGTHAIASCFTGWGRVTIHDRLETILLKWLFSSAGLAFQGKYTYLGTGSSKICFRCIRLKKSFEPPLRHKVPAGKFLRLLNAHCA